MTKQGKKRNLSFSPGGFAGMTTTTVTQILFARYEKPGDSYLAEHFSYEISMLRFADSKIDGLIPQTNRFEREGNESKQRECNAEINMALGTFVMHWRALIEFFLMIAKRRNGRMI